MSISVLVDEYLTGPARLRMAVEGITPEQLAARPIAGQWSTQEVICHLADFEPIYADRMKRTIAEDKPQILSGDPNLFAANLAYADRDLAEELDLIELTRKQIARILRRLPESSFQRQCVHSHDGPLTLETLLRRITGHIPHHVKFIEEKRRLLG